MIPAIRWRPRVGNFPGVWNWTAGWFSPASSGGPPPPPPPPPETVVPLSTVQAIINKAADRSLLNDNQRSKVSNDAVAILAHFGDVIQEIYADASRPIERELVERRDYLSTTEQMTLAIGAAAPLFAYAWTPEFSWNGVRLNPLEQRDLELGVAELPPGIIWTGGKVFPAGRTGDPAAGDVITVRGTAIPAPLQRVTDPIGAVVAGDATTTQWGHMYWLADSYLVQELAWWFAIRSGDREPGEIQEYATKAATAYAKLMKFLRERV